MLKNQERVPRIKKVEKHWHNLCPLMALILENCFGAWQQGLAKMYIITLLSYLSNRLQLEYVLLALLILQSFLIPKAQS